MRTAVILQTRLDSTRLPRKALLPLGAGTLVESVMRRLIELPADVHVLACDEASAPELAPLAARQGYRLFAGPKDDVLCRYAQAVRFFGVETLVRATGDNPFVSVPLASLLIDHSLRHGLDYAGYEGMPVGMGVEVVRAAALLAADSAASDAYDREHVCPYLYRNPQLFRIERPRCPDEYYLPSARLTVDRQEDYATAVRIYRELGNNPADTAILAWLRRQKE